MTVEEATKVLRSLYNVQRLDTLTQEEMTAVRMAIRSLEAWEGVKQDLYKFSSNSFDAECAECYRIALHCVEGHLKEVENESNV